MRTVENPFDLKEKIKKSLEKIKLQRPALLQQFADFYEKQNRLYQPASLKVFYLFDLNRQFNQYVNSFDTALNLAEQLSDVCDQSDDFLKQCVSNKSKCTALLADMPNFLQLSLDDDMARQYLFFVNELCVFESKLKDRKSTPQAADAYENSIKFFRKTFDEYEEYFKHPDLVVETQKIRFLIKQTKYPDLAINDPGHIDFLFYCMSIAANQLRKKMKVAQAACHQSHQAVLKIQELIDSDIDKGYVLDC